MADVRMLLPVIRQLHDRIRDAVVEACERQSVEALSAVAHDDEGDTIYAVDKVSEQLLIEALTAQTKHVGPIVLIAEGLPGEGGKVVLPAGAREDDAAWRIIVDPIDGTRGIMYQKRSAWILTGVAPNRGPATSLRDITLAVQTEIPLIKQHLGDQIWAIKGEGVTAQRLNRLTGERVPLTLRPSGSDTILHGCAGLARFFPGARDVLAAIDDEVILRAVGPQPAGKALCFEDQYAASGGQLYELMAGHDRFIADLRPLMTDELHRRGLPTPLCCHPYDMGTTLIAEELGVVMTDARGQPLDAPLNVEADIAWVGYANRAIQAQVEPALRAALETRGLV